MALPKLPKEGDAWFPAALEECCRRLQRGEALDQWVASYPAEHREEFSRLVLLARRLRQMEEAEDLTLEVFMAAPAGSHGLRAEDEVAFLAWLLRIAHHKVADHARQRRPSAPLPEAEGPETLQPQPDEMAAAVEGRSDLLQGLAQLTPEHREVIVCRHILGYDNERTARLVGKSVSAVNQLQYRSLASLHRLLAKREKPR